MFEFTQRAVGTRCAVPRIMTTTTHETLSPQARLTRIQAIAAAINAGPDYTAKVWYTWPGREGEFRCRAYISDRHHEYGYVFVGRGSGEPHMEGCSKSRVEEEILAAAREALAHL